MRVVDRRGDPPGRSAVIASASFAASRTRSSVRSMTRSAKRGIADIGKGSRISIPGRGLKEPHLQHDHKTGSRDFVLPGNHEYLPGDTIDRPGGGDGEGEGNEPGQGESRDNFAFVLSRDELLQLFFDDLELPNLERTRIGDVTYIHTRALDIPGWRAGQSFTGADDAHVDRTPHCAARRYRPPDRGTGAGDRGARSGRARAAHRTGGRGCASCARAVSSCHSWKRSIGASAPANPSRPLRRAR